MKVLFVASEAAPFIKTGGLADVMRGLPKALAAKGIDVRIVIPKYSRIAESVQKEMKKVYHGLVNLAWRQLYYGIEEIENEGVTVYFVDNEQYFQRDRIYGFDDDAERFAYFSRAVLAMLPHIGFRPDIIHCNDWHTGLVGAFLKEDFQHDPYYENIKVVYTIHNLKYQGIFSPFVMDDVVGLPRKLFDDGNLECDGCVNYMKSGLVYADAVTTVSKTYANEITYPYFGEKLDGYIRSCNGKLTGIMNGLDEDVYNPAKDPLIPVAYTKNNVMSHKAENKEILQKRQKMRINRNIPMIAVVSRLIEDKGMDLITCIMDELVQEDVQLVVIGTGEQRYEDAFRNLARHNPTKVSANILFDEKLAHCIYAAADLLLMPSRYEPCGLSQLIALKYGTIPIVRETGGLKDTVMPFDKYTNTGNGLTFANFNAHELLFTIKRALGYYADPHLWKYLVHNAMTGNYGWSKSAKNYIELYEKVMKK